MIHLPVYWPYYKLLACFDIAAIVYFLILNFMQVTKSGGRP